MSTASSKSNKQSVMNGILVTHDTARWLALGAVAGPILLTLAWIDLGLMRPAVRDAWGVSGGITGMITQPFSGLGLGSNGFLFNTAFVLSGLLIMVGVFGIFQTIEATGSPMARRASAVLLALTGLGSVVCGLFTIQLFIPHMIGFLLGSGTPVLSFLVAGSFLRRIPRWRRFGTWLLLASPLTLVLLVLFFINFNFDTMAAGIGVAGLTERILVIEVQAWYMTMGWLAFRRPDQVGLRM
jgi:hypothetical membrane protein